MIEQGDPLPPNLAGFAVDVLLGKTTKPKRRAAVAPPMWCETQHSERCPRAGIPTQLRPRTRNKASDPYSICDAIAEALTSNTRRLSRS